MAQIVIESIFSVLHYALIKSAIQDFVMKLRKWESRDQFLFLITGYGRWERGEGLQNSELLEGRDQASLIFFFLGPDSESSTWVSIGSSIVFEPFFSPDYLSVDVPTSPLYT